MNGNPSKRELLKQGIEIRREPRSKDAVDRFRLATVNVDFEYDVETNRVTRVIPIIILFGSRNPKQDDISIRHELTHIRQFNPVLFEPLRRRIKGGLLLDDAQSFVDRILPKLNHDKLEREAEKSERI